MDRKTLLIIIIVTGFVGVFLGFVFSLFLIENPNSIDLPVFSDEEIEAKNNLLKEYIDEQAYLQSRIVTLRSKLEEAQKTIEEHSKIATIEKLDDLKKDVGLSEIHGKGLEIFINDVKPSGLVQASDIRDVVNLLRASHTEGISVNNQRIISTSSISSVGNALLVNNSYVVPPIYIHAIGNQQTMLQKLLNKTLLQDIYNRLEKKNIIFQISAKSNLVIPVYNGNLKVDYINLVE